MFHAVIVVTDNDLRDSKISGGLLRSAVTEWFRKNELLEIEREYSKRTWPWGES